MRVVAAAASFSSLLPVMAGRAVTHTCMAVAATTALHDRLHHEHIWRNLDGICQPHLGKPLQAQWQQSRPALRRKPFGRGPQ